MGGFSACFCGPIRKRSKGKDECSNSDVSGAFGRSRPQGEILYEIL